MATEGKGVLYLAIGLKHTTHMIVSLMSLRDWWKGPVAIMTGCEDSKRIADQCIKDKRLGPVERVDFTYRRESGQKSGATYLAKTLMGNLSPFDSTVFLDADTLVVGSFDELWPENGEMVLTQFASWTTQTRKIRGRIEPWRESCPREVEWSLTHEYPAINTGVLAFEKERSRLFMQTWRDVTMRRVCFMCDELACQLIAPAFECRVLDQRFNYSPKFSKGVRDPRVMHGHGAKFIKTAYGRKVWVPYYSRALKQNIAGIADYSPVRADKAAKWQKYEAIDRQKQSGESA